MSSAIKFGTQAIGKQGYTEGAVGKAKRAEPCLRDAVRQGSGLS